MRCETSFFSLTLFKKHLQRYWPMWAVWLAGWILALPVDLWNRQNWGSPRNMQFVRDLAENVDDLLGATTMTLAIAAPIVAVAVFFHLFKAPAANFVGALPMRREGVFATAFAAGYAMLTVPLILVTVLTLIVEGVLGVTALEPLFGWLGGSMLLAFFWLSFATLCCVISGNAVASVSFYIIFNGVVAGMTWLIQGVLQVFLYGFDQFAGGVWQAAMWLTPIYQTSLNNNALSSLGVLSAGINQYEMYWVYAAVGFLMLLAALGLHHIRKSERAADLIAFGPIRWVFRISVTLCGGLAFGMLLLTILFWNADDHYGIYLAGCCAVAAMVSWFVAEMLLAKSFKVFKGHWKGALIGAACFILAICAIDMDWIGFTTRVPDPSQVKSATAGFSGHVDPVATEGLTYDADTVAQLIELHQYLVDHQENASANREYYCWLEVEYDLGLTHLRREYSFRYDKGDELARLAAAAQRTGTPDLDLTLGDPAEGWVQIITDDDTDQWYHDLDPVQAQAAWAAIRADVEAGRYRADQPDAEWTDHVELGWIDAAGHRVRQNFYPRASATSLNAFLADLQAKWAVEEGEEEPSDHLPATEEIVPAAEVTQPPGTDGRVSVIINGQELLVTPIVARQLLDIAEAEAQMISAPLPAE